MPRPVEIAALPDFRLRIRYSDGVVGEVDLSHLAGEGVFAAWNVPGRFENVSIGSAGEIRWGDELDLCPDALYLEITGQAPDELFPNLKALADA